MYMYHGLLSMKMAYFEWKIIFGLSSPFERAHYKLQENVLTVEMWPSKLKLWLFKLERLHTNFVSLDLDSQLATGADPSTLLDSIPDQQTNDSFSSYTRVTITQRPDGVRIQSLVYSVCLIVGCMSVLHMLSVLMCFNLLLVCPWLQSIEERRCHRDSHGNEEETTIIKDTRRKETFRNKLSDWVWPKQ